MDDTAPENDNDGELMNELMNEWINKQTNEQMNEWKDDDVSQ